MRIANAVNEQELIRRLSWRILPMVMGLYLCAIIDRSNIGFAKLQMIDELHLTEVGFALGSSLFFFSYIAVEIPSALAAYRFGARLWLARIAFTWGLLTVLLAFSNSGFTFYALRFLLGAAEGGLYPAAVFYLTLWFPERHRAHALAVLTLGSAFGNMLSALISGPLLDLHGMGGLSGWQWVFIATGLPPILLSLVVLKFLPSNLAEADFLSSEEKAWLSASRQEPEHHGNPLGAMVDPKVLGLAVVYTLINISLFGVIYWLPTVIKGFGVTGTQNGLLNAVPWALAAVLLSTLPRRLQTERAILMAAAIFTLVGLCSFAAATMLPSNSLRFAALAIGTPCISLLYPCFWFFPSRMFKGSRGAAGIAVINTIGLLGGFIGQNLMPSVAQAVGSSVGAMIVPAVCLGMLWLTCMLRSFQASGRRPLPAVSGGNPSDI